MGKLKKFRDPFTMVPNQLILDNNVSLKSKGLWAYMQSKPDGWDFSADRIASELLEGREAILVYLKELEESGYINRSKRPSGHMDYELTIPIPKSEYTTEASSHGSKLPLRHLPTHNKERLIRNKEVERKKEVISNVRNVFSDESVKIENALVAAVRNNFPALKVKDPKGRWASDIEKIHRIDGYTWDQIIKVAAWSQQDSFWKQNIRSGSKLRDKFPDLLVRYQSTAKKVYGNVESISF